MSWDLHDEDVRRTLTEGLAPPSNVNDLFADDMWANVFSLWATDLGFQRGDYTASHLFDLWKDHRSNVGYETIRDKYVAPGNPYDLQWPPAVTDRFERTDAGMDDQSGTLAELWNAAVERLDPYQGTFRRDIEEIQSSAASEPVPMALTRDRIDQQVVDSINQSALKSLPEAGGMDSFVEFWMKGDLLLIGEDHPAGYLAFARDGGTQGQIYMNAKGGVFSRGELLVQGVGGGNQDSFKEALRRFSQKKVSFR